MLPALTSVLIAMPPSYASASVLRSLRAENVVAVMASDGIGMLDKLRAGGVGLVVLDVELPGLDIDVLLAAAHREAPSVPIVVLTPRERRGVTIAQLRGQRDDYLLRPFAVDELLARIWLRLQAGPPLDQTILRRGPLVVDTVLGEASVDGSPAGLSPTEFAMLKVLISAPERPVTAQQLAEKVWDRPASANLVQVYVGYLRRKIGTDLIRTVRGAGYVLEA